MAPPTRLPKEIEEIRRSQKRSLTNGPYIIVQVVSFTLATHQAVVQIPGDIYQQLGPVDVLGTYQPVVGDQAVMFISDGAPLLASTAGVAVTGPAGAVAYVWVDYVPTWTIAELDVNVITPPSIGDGQLRGRYRLWSDGKVDTVQIQMIVGSTTDLGDGTSLGDGQLPWYFSAPLATNLDYSYSIGIARAFAPLGTYDTFIGAYRGTAQVDVREGASMISVWGDTNDALVVSQLWGPFSPLWPHSGDFVQWTEGVELRIQLSGAFTIVGD